MLILSVKLLSVTINFVLTSLFNSEKKKGGHIYFTIIGGNTSQFVFDGVQDVLPQNTAP